MKDYDMFRFSWALALAFTLATLTGILIVTRDLAVTNDVFKEGVAQAETVDVTTNTALKAATELKPADRALREGLPQVVGVLGSLSQAEETLGSLATQLGSLGSTLAAADLPLVGIIKAGKAATVQANAAARPAETIVGTLKSARGKVRDLGPELDRTIALARIIESKLRILLMLPVVR